METINLKCVLLADRHHSLTEGVRGLLETVSETVMMVADEISLFESAERLQPTLAVVDLSLIHGANLYWLRQLRRRSPDTKMILISVHNEASVCRAALAAGADGFVVKSGIATELLAAVDAVMAGKQFVSTGVLDRPPTNENNKES